MASTVQHGHHLSTIKGRVGSGLGDTTKEGHCEPTNEQVNEQANEQTNQHANEQANNQNENLEEDDRIDLNGLLQTTYGDRQPTDAIEERVQADETYWQRSLLKAGLLPANLVKEDRGRRMRSLKTLKSEATCGEVMTLGLPSDKPNSPPSHPSVNINQLDISQHPSTNSVTRVRSPSFSSREPHTAIMSTKGGTRDPRGGSRGKMNRLPGIHPMLETTPTPFIVNAASSVTSGRRPRGFQPAEIGKPKQDHGVVHVTSVSQQTMQQDHPPEFSSLSHIHQRPTTSYQSEASVSSEKSAPHQSVRLPNQKAESSTFKAETIAAHPSHTDFDQADTGHNTDTPGTPSSSIEIVTDAPKKSWLSQAMAAETQTPQKSWLSQAVDADPGWDNSSVDLSMPVWMRPIPASTIPNMPFRQNMALLPAYKFPISKKKQDAASASFNRQVAEIQKEASPTAKHAREPPHLQSPPQLVSASKVRDSLHVPIIPLVKQIEEKTNLRDQKKPQIEKASASQLQSNAKLPPHLRTPDSGRVESKNEKKPSEDEAKLPPHLRTPGSRVTPSPRTTSDDAHKVNAEGRAEKTAIVEESSVELHTNGISNQKSHHNNGIVTQQPAVNIDEEVAASLGVADRFDHDEAVAAVIQAESFYEEILPHQHPHVIPSLQPEIESFFDEIQTPASHYSSNMMTNRIGIHQSYRPPHLRASTPAQRTPVLQEVTKSHNSNFNQAFRKDTDANGRESAVKAGKRPVVNTDFLTLQAGANDFGNSLAPPPIGNDWNERKKYDAKGNLASIESWRQEPTGQELDTKDPDFQTGKGHASGEQKIMSPINQADHIALPNDDDFSQAKRDQNAAAAIENYNAQRLADGKPPYSEDTEKNSPTAEEKRAANRARAVKREAERRRPIPPSEFAPAANIYIRPAEAKDMRQCMKIYNYYATETPSVGDLKEVSEAYWNSRFQESANEYKPFVVAIHMGQKRYTNLKDIRRRKNEDVVGFSVAAEYGAQGTVYRHTVELDLFVHPLHLRQGIAGTLLDRMLSALDPGYNLIERAPFLGDYKMHDWVGGGHCICKTILINILHEANDTAGLEWKMKWLSNQRMNFVLAGTLPQIGFKKEKELNLTQMVLRTMSTCKVLI